MSITDLGEREKKIFKNLIDHYITTAEPVGSRTLSRRYKIGLSAASIRNILKDLEDMGYLVQPHTSAGRVPTNEGYRSYVDYLLTPENLTDSEKTYIRDNMKTEYTAVGQLLEQTSRILSNLSKQLGVAMTPKFESAVLTRLELIPVAEKKLMVVLVVKSGLIKSILIEVDSNLPDLALGETSRVLNERLCGLTLGEIKKTIRERVKNIEAGDAKLIRLFVEGSDEIWDLPPDENLHFGSTTNLFRQPEFRNPRDMAEMVGLIEDRTAISQMFDRTGIEEGISINIGYKTVNEKSEQLSLLTSSYNMGKVKGMIGVIGPTRMNYAKLVSLVDYTARMLSEVFAE